MSAAILPHISGSPLRAIEVGMMTSSLTFYGSKWMTGGTVGPEASVLCIIILVLFWLMILARFPEERHPNSYVPRCRSAFHRTWIITSSIMAALLVALQLVVRRPGFLPLGRASRISLVGRESQTLDFAPRQSLENRLHAFNELQGRSRGVFVTVRQDPHEKRLVRLRR